MGDKALSKHMSGNTNSILIVLVGGIGDLILASRSIRAIRNGFPSADIHLLTSTDASSIAQNYPFVDHVWGFPIREMRKSKYHLFDVIKLLFHLRKTRFNLVVNLYRVSSRIGALKMGIIFLLLNAKAKIGHDSKGFGLVVTNKVPKATFSDLHIADAMMLLARSAGGRPDGNGIEIFWDSISQEKWKYLFSAENQSPHKIDIGINAGGDRENRRWNPNNYAALADKLIEKFNAKIILLAGPGEEYISLQIHKKMKNDSIDLGGKLTLNDLTFVISELDLLITNDSGPMHIGAATQTPLVAIFGPENPTLFHPYTSPDKYIVVYKHLDCQPCKTKKCDHISCLNDITVSEVFEATEKMLSSQHKL
jgi:ADP-heptose:LPS heptosyltransferase